ncbi:MAG: hypothetical protein V1821_00960 [bacterium]
MNLLLVFCVILVVQTPFCCLGHFNYETWRAFLFDRPARQSLLVRTTSAAPGSNVRELPAEVGFVLPDLTAEKFARLASGGLKKLFQLQLGIVIGFLAQGSEPSIRAVKTLCTPASAEDPSRFREKVGLIKLD